jgi:hypothetical protein
MVIFFFVFYFLLQLSVGNELTNFSSSVYDPLEDQLGLSYKSWLSNDSTALTQIQKVMAEFDQRKRVVQMQVSHICPQLAQITRDVLQLERYRLDPPNSIHMSNPSGPADAFLRTTTNMIQGFINSMQNEQNWHLQQHRFRGAVNENEMRLKIAVDEEKWLIENPLFSISTADEIPFKSRLIDLLSQQLPRWAMRCSTLCPILLPFLENFSRVSREMRSPFISIGKNALHSEIGKDIIRIKQDLDIVQTVLTAFVQQGVIVTSPKQIDSFLSTLRAYQPLLNGNETIVLNDGSTSIPSANPLADLTQQTLEQVTRLPNIIQSALYALTNSKTIRYMKKDSRPCE